MAREIRTDPAQSTGLRSKKNCGHGRDFFLDFYLLRKLSSSGCATFECDCVTEALEAFDVIVGQALRVEAVEEVRA
jgi:hypothetical protein